MTYIPHSEEEVSRMLAAIGVESIDRLFHEAIPEKYRASPLDLPKSKSEQELAADFGRMAERSRRPGPERCFAGAGAYQHYIPAYVDQMLLRSEFYTAYTPYQPEVSQGTLAAIFEYQTLIAILTGMDVANASTYDGGSAAAEAVLMALRIKRKQNRVLVAGSLSPEYRLIIKTYLTASDAELVEIGYAADGRLDLDKLKESLDDNTAAVLVGYPNHFGIIEDIGAIAEVVEPSGALLITATPEPLSLALVKSPGELGADIAVGEGQSFGNPVSFGGPGLGLFAVKEKFVRQLPGRLVGQTVDSKGVTGYCLTLSTREQHIRREKATSNICSNENLCALAATIYLAGLGRTGLVELAKLNLSRAVSLKKALSSIEGVELLFDAPHFNEFAVRLPASASEVVDRMANCGWVAGVDLSADYPNLGNALLCAATELNDSQSIGQFAESLADVLKELR